MFYSCSSYHQTSHKPIGFIGLGAFGASMVVNLAKQGYPLIIYDVVQSAVEATIMSAGGSPLAAKSPAEVALRTTRIITMLPSTLDSLDAYTGEYGIFSAVRSETLLIECSTIDPSAAQDLAGKARKLGAIFMDAPALGTVNDAEDAKLTFLVGGPKPNFFDATEILSIVGKKVVHCGGTGMGQACKICNNMLVGITMLGVSEVMNLGIRLGVEPEHLTNVINMSTGRCWSSESYNPVPGIVENVPANNDYKGGIPTDKMAQDLALALSAGMDIAAPTPLGSQAYQLYRLMCSHGYKAKDFSSSFKFLQQQLKPDWE